MAARGNIAKEKILILNVIIIYDRQFICRCAKLEYFEFSCEMFNF